MCSLERWWVAGMVCAALAVGACSAPPERSRPQVPPNPDPHIQRAVGRLEARSADPEVDAARRNAEDARLNSTAASADSVEPECRSR